MQVLQIALAEFIVSTRMTTYTDGLSPSVVGPPISVRLALDGMGILVTGATGFLGKALVEKLLRDTNTGPIFLLMRASTTVEPPLSAQQRLVELLASSVLDRLRHELGAAGFRERVSRLVVVEGDVVAPQCGLSDADAETVVRAVRVVLHCAGSTDLNEDFGSATSLNVRGTLNVQGLAARCDLVALVSVSAAQVCGKDNQNGEEPLLLGALSTQTPHCSCIPIKTLMALTYSLTPFHLPLYQFLSPLSNTIITLS
jgi:fatty acyl-CoA reductase